MYDLMKAANRISSPRPSVIALTGIALNFCAYAQESITTQELHLSLSLGEGYAQTPYVAADDIHLRLLPSIAYYGERWFFDNGTLGYALFESERFQIDAQISPNIDGLYANYAGADRLLFLSQVIPTPFGTDHPGPVEGRKIAINGGIRFNYLGENLSSWLELKHDVNSVYNGYEAAFGVRYDEALRFGDLRIGTEFGGTYKARDLIDYYYNPRPAEFPESLHTYRPQSAINPYLQVDMQYPLTQHFSLIAFGRKSWLADTFQESPFSGKRGLTAWFAGIRVSY
ncbi:MAG: MipA/OmpV family protein [Gammaproteobacteria bacterium]|nr:MipA/OmpV family protein [Gammaproteobacteria bacterium]